MRKNNEMNLLKNRHEWINQIGHKARKKEGIWHQDSSEMVPI